MAEAAIKTREAAALLEKHDGPWAQPLHDIARDLEAWIADGTERERASFREAHATCCRKSNHYDRYWTPPPGRVTAIWLADTEAKMREALEDEFCDDAAAVMLTLIAEIQRLRVGGSIANA